MRMRLKGKAIAMIVAMLIVFFGATLAINYRQLRDHTVAMKTAEIDAAFHRFKNDIDDFTDNQVAKARALAELGRWVYELERRSPELDAPNTAMELALSQLRTVSDPAILGGGIWYEPFVLEPDKKWVGPYAIAAGPGEAKPNWEYSTDAYAYTTHDWYTIAVPAGWDRGKPRMRDLYMTEPYLDSLDGRPTVFITFTHVMYDNDRRIIGVSTADWTFDSLAATLSQFRVTERSFSFLVHEPSGKVLFPVDRAELARLGDAPWGRHVDLAAAAEPGAVVRVDDVTVGGRTYDVWYARTNAGFVFGHFVATDDAYGFVGQIAGRYVWLALITLVLAALATWLVVSRLVGPLRQLAVSARRIADGDLDHRAQVATRDEIGELAMAFNQAHARVRESASKLRASEEHFRALIENATDLIAVIDGHGAIRYASPSVQRALGYAPDALVGTPLPELVHPDDAGELDRGFARMAMGRSPVESASARLKHADGGWRAFETISTRHGDGFIVNARDVTERRRTEEALARSESQLRQAAKLEAIGRLAGGIAHDFNNAMTAVLGSTQLLLRRHRDDPKLVSTLTEIRAAGEHATSLTRQLLTFSRSNVVQPEPIDLNGVVLGIEPMLRRLIGADVELTTSLAQDLRPIMADVRELEQVLVNLTVNARDAMKDGGGIVLRTAIERITAPMMSVNGQLAPGSYCVLTVADTGTGMDATTISKIFDPFFSTKGEDLGTGLGLSTVYGIVKNSGGYILVDSEPGEGTRFHIYWPPTQMVSERRKRESVANHHGVGEVALVVEDDDRVRRVTVEALEMAGFTVVQASDGAEALDLVRDGKRVDVLITDVVMPRMKGPQLVAELEQLQPGVPVVFVSGYVAGQLGAGHVESPTHTYLQKPFTPDQLVGKVRQVLDAAAAAADGADAADTDDAPRDRA